MFLYTNPNYITVRKRIKFVLLEIIALYSYVQYDLCEKHDTLEVKYQFLSQQHIFQLEIGKNVLVSLDIIDIIVNYYKNL